MTKGVAARAAAPRRRDPAPGACTAICAAALSLLPTGPATAAPASEVLAHPRFGAVTIYRGSGEPRDLVLFISGDGGWNLGVVSMAESLADQGAIVAGVDIRHYLAQLEKSRQQCVSPAMDFENLSHYLQAKLGLKVYLQPTLVGYSSGATLAYATLAESADGLFKGALSIGFCPDLDLKKSVCRGSGIEATTRRGADGLALGVDFLPVKKLSAPWISLQGDIDQVCPAAATEKFVDAVPGAEIVRLPKVGHGYSVEKNWLPQYEAAYQRLTAPRSAGGQAVLPAAVADLPLTIVPAAPGGGMPGSPCFCRATAAGPGSIAAYRRSSPSRVFRSSAGTR